MTDQSNDNGKCSESGLQYLLEQMSEAEIGSALPSHPQIAPLPKHLSYASVVDVRDRETEITDLMVKRACMEAEDLLQFPFAVKKSAL